MDSSISTMAVVSVMPTPMTTMPAGMGKPWVMHMLPLVFMAMPVVFTMMPVPTSCLHRQTDKHGQTE